jgi:PAS domain S-box-containing protein
MTTILVVDDTPTDLELLATILRYAGYRVLAAASGESALELVRRERPALVIADILMPGMDGYEFVRELRRDPVSGGISVIFCTATYSGGDVTRLAEVCGVRHVLLKPCEPEEILRVVAQALDSATGPSPAVAARELGRGEHLGVVNAKLIEEIDQLERARSAQARRHQELLRADRERAESLMLLETLLSSAPVGFGFLDREFRVQRLNGTLAAITDLPYEQQLGRTVAEVVPELWPRLEPEFRGVLETGEAVVNKAASGQSAAAPGRTAHWLASYYPVRVDDEVVGIGVLVVDVTER